nr:nectin-3 isoform X5 [Chrysemys picta bellii]
MARTAAAAPPTRGELSAAAADAASSPPRRPPALPGPGLLGLGLLLCCGALAGPVVDPHVTAVWGKNVTLKCIIEINETITQISWEKIHGKSTQTIAVHHPEYGFSVQGEYQGRVSFKNYSLTDATIILNNISFSDSGEYVCKAVTFPLGNAQSSTTVTVLGVIEAVRVQQREGILVQKSLWMQKFRMVTLAVEPIVSLTKGPNSLIDGENQTIAAICTAATGKPAADVDWEGGLGEMESRSTLFPNETVTVVSQYKLIPTKFARGRRITCVVRHPALEKEMRYPYTLDILYAPEVSVTGYDGNWFIGREHVQLRCNADANPLPMEFTWTRTALYRGGGIDVPKRLDGQWPEGLISSNNTLHFNSPLTYNYTGTYVCKVTNSLGQRSDQKTIYILDMPFKQTSSVAVAGAVIGAVLALFIITIFVTVLLTPKKKRPSYLDKVIDLPPTHKPPPSYEERSLSVSQKEVIQRERFPLQSQYKEKEAGNLQNIKAVNGRQLNYEDENPLSQENLQQMYPVHKQICYKDWSSKYHQNPGTGRIYINPREHYV